MASSLVSIDINKIMELSENDFEISKIIIQLIKRKNNINLNTFSKFNITGIKIKNVFIDNCKQNYDVMIDYLENLENNN